jgi:nitrate/TMAO reductase-like tetraheme cytochrome c subunit
LGKPLGLGGWIGLIALGAILAVAALGTFGAVAESTSGTEFCISCHEMKQNFDEYAKTVHYKNREGVQAQCSDCHVPKSFAPKMMAKVVAVKDVVHHVLGTIGTPEKYAAHKLDMAQRVWAKMEANGSAQCRSCHNFQAMDFDQQGRRSRMKHEASMQDGKTCISCHKGIAHSLPDGYVRE